MNLFIMTGVCQPGEPLNLTLAKFLDHADARILLWIDFKDREDYCKVAAVVRTECPRATLRCAPNAIWGAPSIVASMLEAASVCLRDFEIWDRIVFCSIRDAPLASSSEIVSCLDREWNFDYCGSRWNCYATDILRPLSLIPVTEGWSSTEVFDQYRLRPDMSLRIDAALQSIFTPEAVSSFRLCGDLFERYIVSAWEFAPKALLTIQRMTRMRAAERYEFFSTYGLFAGRQWCVLSRRFCDMLLGPKVIEVYSMFCDVLIADECFFQTVANHFERAGQISVKWDNIFFGDAQSTNVDLKWLRQWSDRPPTKSLLARKLTHWTTSQDLEKIFQ